MERANRMTNPTNTYWTDDRLNQLAALSAANAEAIAQSRQQQEATTANIEVLREQQAATNTNIDILVGIVTAHQERFTALLEEIREIKAEIRGLQTENRRILDHLLEQDNENL